MTFLIRIALTGTILLGVCLGQADYNLHILYTANNNGVLLNCHCPKEPWGGLEKRQTLIRTWAQDHPAYLLFDSGDFLSFKGDERKDGRVIKAMELMGYNAVNIGDQEFSNGVAFFRESIQNSQLPLVSSNFKNQDQVLMNHIVIPYQGLEIGVMGVLDPRSYSYYSDNKDPTEDFMLMEPARALERVYQHTEALQQVDVLIVLSNVGLEADRLLAEACPFIDVILGGHSQDLLAQPVYHSGALILQPGKNGQFVGHLSLDVRDGRLKRYRNEFLKVAESLKDAPEIMAVVQE